MSTKIGKPCNRQDHFGFSGKLQKEASPGTIRGDLGIEIGRNLVHGSDSSQSAEREISIFFDNQVVENWKRDSDPWIFE